MTNDEMKFQDLVTLLEGAKDHFLKPIERNIFSIGGKGHYENPISDVLAFFCDSSEGHGLGVSMVRAMFNALSASEQNRAQENLKEELEIVNGIIAESKTQPETYIVTMVSREMHTGSGFIDIVLKGPTWVMTIENKIRHWQANDFNDYKTTIDKKREYKNKKKLYVVLSPNGDVYADSAQGHWLSLSYKNLLDCIKNEKYSMQVNIERPFNKWPILLREFILNLEEETMPEQIDDKEIKYFFENAYDLAYAEKEQIKQLRQVAIRALGNKLRSQIEQKVSNELSKSINVNVDPFEDSWGNDGEYNYPIFNFYLDSWKPIDCRVQLALEKTGTNEKIDSCTIWYGVQTGRGSNVMKENIISSESLGCKYETTSPGTWYWYKCETNPNFNIDDQSEIVGLVVKKLIKLNDFVNEHNAKN